MRDFLARLLLNHSETALFLRRVPVFGAAAHRIGRRLVPPGTRVWAKVRDGLARGLWLRLDPRTGTHFWRGAGEIAVQQALVEHLRPGMVFYDIGANIGFFSLLAARLVGPSGRVFAFEPEPALLPRLLENIARNGFDHITVVGKAVTATSGEIFFEPADSHSSPDFGLGRIREEATCTTVPVAGVALDDFVLQHPWPDVVKCDAEGAEVDILRGATQLLRARRTIFVIETHSATHERAVCELLEQHGYTVTRLDELHVLARSARFASVHSGGDALRAHER
ncbi:MAG: FkbM family methyltransferase [Firmicutes bacterium]|nr:FkbM family methyltransferase [Bacillota bacterium]